MMNFDDFASDKDAFEAGYSFVSGAQQNLYWLYEGYCVDFMFRNDKMVVLGFLEPKDFVLRMSDQSIVMSMGEVTMTSISAKNLRRVLKLFPECHFHYRHFRQLHRDKIERYHQELATKSAGERYFDLLERYPWVMAEDYARYVIAYLQISPAAYDRMRRVE